MILFGFFASAFYDGMYYIGSIIKEVGNRIQRVGEDLETYMSEDDYVVLMEELETDTDGTNDEFNVK